MFTKEVVCQRSRLVYNMNHFLLTFFFINFDCNCHIKARPIFFTWLDAAGLILLVIKPWYTVIFSWFILSFFTRLTKGYVALVKGPATITWVKIYYFLLFYFPENMIVDNWRDDANISVLTTIFIVKVANTVWSNLGLPGHFRINLK